MQPHPASAGQLDDPERLHSLHGLPPDLAAQPAFGRLARLAARLLGAPVALVTVVYPDRQLFIGSAGLGEPWASAGSCPLELSICRHVVASGAPLVVPDSADHPLFAASPAVDAFEAAAYIGVPLRSEDGTVLGACCAIDRVPRAWVADDLAALSDLAASASGELTRIQLAAQEGARRRAEEELRLRGRVIAASSQGIVITDAAQPDNPIIYCNPAFEQMTGYAAAEILGRNCRLLQGPDTDAASSAEVRHAIRAGAACSVTMLNYRKDGSTFWNALSITPVYDDGGALTHFVGVQNDVSAQMAALGALRRSELLLSAVVEHIPQMLVVKDAATLRFVRLNRAGEELLACSRDELIGKGDDEVFPIDEAALLADRDREALRRDGLEIAAEAVQTPGLGRRLLRTQRVPIRSGDGTSEHLLLIAEDVTERQQAEQALRERHALERQLQETQKLESLGILAGGIAHDFNNMLAAVLGNAELALCDLDADHPARYAVEQIGLASRRAAELTAQLLAYSGRGRLLVGDHDLNAIAREMAALLRASIPKAVALSFDEAEGLPPVAGDATQLRQVLMNLVINGAEAIGPAGGLVTLRSGVRCVDRAFLAGCAVGADLPPGVYVALEVSDTGAGIEEAALRKVFEPFFTTKARGRGLGLAAVLGIVRAHGGAIHIATRPGQGSTFTVLLPPADGQDHAVGQAEAARGPRSTADASILVVDDEADVRLVAERMLARLGYRAQSVPDGQAALRHVDANADTAAVLLDIAMPGLSGEQTFAALRELRPRLPVLVISGHSEQDMRGRLGADGALDVLQKPFTPAELQRKLEAVILRGGAR